MTVRAPSPSSPIEERAKGRNVQPLIVADSAYFLRLRCSRAATESFMAALEGANGHTTETSI